MNIFVKTINIDGMTDEQLSKIPAGQWVKAYADGPTGRFYGHRRGVTVIAYASRARSFPGGYREYMKRIRAYAAE